MVSDATYPGVLARRPAAGTARLAAVAVLTGLAAFVALQIRAYTLAGVFEYPIDDVYIHLAMALGMAHGTYGVNAGEAASAASSILYPVLLMPLAGDEAQRFLPLVWNVAGLIASAALWGVIVAEARLTGWFAYLIAAAGPVALNMSGVAFVGMEHSLHAAASLATVLGLWRYLIAGRIAPWFVAAMVLAPLLRLEGLALSLAAAAVIALTGRWRVGLGIAFAVLAPVLAFSGALVALGLPPLPSSVLTKMARAPAGTGQIQLELAKLAFNLATQAGLLIAALVLGSFAVIPAIRAEASAQGADPRTGRAATWLLTAVPLAGIAHLIEGRIGWLDRYEHYIVVSLVAGLILASAALRAVPAKVLRAVLVVAIAAGAWVWLPPLWGRYVWNPRGVDLQHGQMARFAQDFLGEPVAVNDIGRVVWRNPNYVLDLWGLASERARRLRQEGTAPAGWAGMLTREKGVRLAMIYEGWIGAGIGPDWRRIARLTMRTEHLALGGGIVSFYATDPAAAPELTAKLRDFAATLPPDAILEFE